jgi:agmatinase
LNQIDRFLIGSIFGYLEIRDGLGNRFLADAPMSFVLAILYLAAPLVYGHGNHHGGDQFPLTEVEAAPQTWLEKYGKQIDQPFSGPLAFSHLPYTRCLEDEKELFDIAILGMPFDTGVTYRPG